MERSSIRIRIALVMWWIGLALAIAGIGLSLARISLAGGLTLGGGMVLLGLNTLLAGDLVTGPGARPFSVRGPVVRGHMEASTGLSDLNIGMCGPDRIASLAYGPIGKPGFEMVEGVAWVRLKSPVFPPSLAQWRADLAGNVLWDIETQSWLGSLNLDLGNLRLEKVTARTTLGRVKITCPTRGYAEIWIKAELGDVELVVPPQTGIKLTIKRGRLASLAVRNPRLTQYRPDRYGTQDYELAGAQAEVIVETWAGDIVVS